MIQQLIGLFALIAFCSAGPAKVSVSLYYEALCPDSHAFITQQLYPVVKNELKDYVQITFVPFGKSNYSTQGADTQFTCHHGPNECYGNKIHACAINHIQSNSYEIDHTRESLIMDFVNCMMQAANFKDQPLNSIGEKCARDNHINNWDNIAQCAQGYEGSNLLKQYGDQTNSLRPPLKNVPTVVFNQQFDQEVQNKALINFRGALCRFISRPWPQVCEAGNSASSLYVVPALTVATYLITKML